LIAGSTFGNRPIAVKVGLGSTWAELGCHANGRNRRGGKGCSTRNRKYRNLARC
jgi:hypothetical protein